MHKFNTIFESNFQRFQGGGFLTGDLVKIVDSAMNHEWVSEKGENVKEQIRKFMESEYNIRISTVKPVRPAVQGSIQQDQVPGYYFCDVALEKAPGMFLDFMELPAELLEVIDTGINLPPVSNANKRDDTIQIKPQEVAQVQEDDDQGDLGVKGATVEDNELTDSNTTLPGATGAKSYTSNYIS
jgi:hypothetical protein